MTVTWNFSLQEAIDDTSYHMKLQIASTYGAVRVLMHGIHAKICLSLYQHSRLFSRHPPTADTLYTSCTSFTTTAWKRKAKEAYMLSTNELRQDQWPFSCLTAANNQIAAKQTWSHIAPTRQPISALHNLGVNKFVMHKVGMRFIGRGKSVRQSLSMPPEGTKSNTARK